MPLSSTSGASSSRSRRRSALVTRGLLRPCARPPAVHYRRRVIEAVLGLLAGVGLLLAGVVVDVVLVAVAGFVVMLACSMWAVTSTRRMTGKATGRNPVKDRGPGNRRHAARGPRPGQQAGSGLMERLEERWRRRQQGNR